MNSKLNNQEGMGVLGILIIFIMLGAFFLFGLRAFPLYTEYFSVKQAMSSVAAAKYENRNSIIKYKLVGPITKDNYDNLLKNIKKINAENEN